MERRLLVGMLCLAVMLAAPATWADVVGFTPDGTELFNFDASGGFAYGAVDPSTGNISLQFMDFFGGPLVSSLQGGPDAFAYWLQFTGLFTSDGHPIYHLFINQAGHRPEDFFFVEDVTL